MPPTLVIEVFCPISPVVETFIQGIVGAHSTVIFVGCVQEGWNEGVYTVDPSLGSKYKTSENISLDR
jgi:hypothetical protein